MPVSGVSDSMRRALYDLVACNPRAHFVHDVKTAVAMLNRGWIVKQSASVPVGPRTLYSLTVKGIRVHRLLKADAARTAITVPQWKKDKRLWRE